MKERSLVLGHEAAEALAVDQSIPTNKLIYMKSICIGLILLSATCARAEITPWQKKFDAYV